MKKTTWIEFYSILKRTWISFVTVFILLMAGTGVYTGFEWGVKATELSVEKVYRDRNFHAYEVFCSSGIRADIPGKIETAEGVRSAYRFFSFGGRRVQAKIFSITEKIDTLFQVEGVLPEGPAELVLEKHFAIQNGISIGDRICFEEAEDAFLAGQVFTVTALAESPAFLSDEASTYGIRPGSLNPVECLMFVREDAFSRTVSGFYSEMLVAGEITAEELIADLTALSGEPENAFTVLSGIDNPAWNIIDNSIDSFRKLKYSMGAMLILISQIVSFIFLEKTVRGQRKNVGMKKALGFNNKEIAMPFLIYGVFCALPGAVTGILLGRFVLETVFLSINQATIFFTEPVYYFSLSESVLLVAGETMLSLLTVLFALRKVLAADALEMLSKREERQLSGGIWEKTSRWERLPVLTKAVINNVRSERSRRYSMILCIAGCTLLLVSSLTVKELVAGSFLRHFDAIQTYDTLIYFDAKNESAPEKISKALLKNSYSGALIHLETGSIQSAEGKGVGAYLIVPLDEAYQGMFTFRNTDGTVRESGIAGESGEALISEAYSDYYGIKEGDTVRYLSADGKEMELIIAGVSEYYLQTPCLHMSADNYRKVFGTATEANAFAADTGKTAGSSAFEELCGTEGYIVTYDMYSGSKQSFDNMSFVCTAVVIIFSLLSLIMAVFVILSLFTSAVESRKREIVVMQINGVPRKRVIGYAFADVALYAVIGIVLGNIGGYWFGRLTTELLSGYTDCFLKTVSVRAVCFGTGACTFLVLLMGVVSLRRIDTFEVFDLAEDTGSE